MSHPTSPAEQAAIYAQAIMARDRRAKDLEDALRALLDWSYDTSNPCVALQARARAMLGLNAHYTPLRIDIPREATGGPL